jgi:hypothetical protein
LEDWVSHLDVIWQSSKTVYSHLKNKKKELKSILEYIIANNLYKIKIRIKVASFIEVNLTSL